MRVQNGVSPEQAVEWFRLRSDSQPTRYGFAWVSPLLGHDLACWCPLDQPCHADVLIELIEAAA
jgi:hypothetical protein